MHARMLSVVVFSAERPQAAATAAGRSDGCRPIQPNSARPSSDTRRIRRDWAPWRWIGRPCGRWHSPPRTCARTSNLSPRGALTGRAQRRVGRRGHVIERRYAQRPFWRLFALGGSRRPHYEPGGCHPPQTAAVIDSNVVDYRVGVPRPKHRGALRLL